VARSVAASLTRSGVVFRSLDGPAPRLVTGLARLVGSEHPGAVLLHAVILDVTRTDQPAKSQTEKLVLDGSQAAT
jgi:hypothetical protein